MMKKKQILVRADDLGYSKGVNYGIADALEGGIIQSVGVMANMPEAQKGLELIAGKNVCLGLHTNICLGKPLTDPKLIPSLVQENGEFKTSKTYRNSKEDFVNLEEVMLEIEAQYERFVQLTGQKPDYLEGHAVMSENFFKGMEIVAKQHDCDYFSMSLTGAVQFRNSEVALLLESSKPDYDPKQVLKEIATRDFGQQIPILICHPGYLDDYLIKTSSLLEPRTLEVEMARDTKLKEELEKSGVEFITYRDIQ